jgi:hypothetical protein
MAACRQNDKDRIVELLLADYPVSYDDKCSLARYLRGDFKRRPGQKKLTPKLKTKRLAADFYYSIKKSLGNAGSKYRLHKRAIESTLALLEHVREEDQTDITPLSEDELQQYLEGLAKKAAKAKKKSKLTH